jgi:hypothetical protein
VSDCDAVTLAVGVTLLDADTEAVDERDALAETEEECVDDGVLELVTLWLADLVTELLAVPVLLPLSVALWLAVADTLLLPLLDAEPLALGKTLAEKVRDGVDDGVNDALRVAVSVPLGLMTAVSWMSSRTAPFEPVSSDTNLMTGLALAAVNVYAEERHPKFELLQPALLVTTTLASSVESANTWNRRVDAPSPKLPAYENVRVQVAPKGVVESVCAIVPGLAPHISMLCDPSAGVQYEERTSEIWPANTRHTNPLGSPPAPKFE